MLGTLAPGVKKLLGGANSIFIQIQMSLGCRKQHAPDPLNAFGGWRDDQREIPYKLPYQPWGR